MAKRRAAPEPPDGLTAEQAAAWREAVASLADPSRANHGQLEVYARELVRLRASEAHVAQFGVMVPAPRTGAPIENPHLKIAREAGRVVARLSRELGVATRDDVPSDNATLAPYSGAPMAISTYAKRRGCSPKAVRRAIDSGRLRDSVVVLPGKTTAGTPVRKIRDPELADREWAANTGMQGPAEAARVEREPGEAVGEADLEYAEARRRKEIELLRQARAKAETDELELGKRRGELVEVATIRAEVVDAYTRVRTKLLGLPSRCRQQLGDKLTASDVVLIESFVVEALEELAGGE